MNFFMYRSSKCKNYKLRQRIYENEKLKKDLFYNRSKEITFLNKHFQLCDDPKKYALAISCWKKTLNYLFNFCSMKLI